MFDVFRRSAIARLMAAMVVGGLVGAFAPECVIRALNSFAGTFSQFVKFIVPLIIFGLVTPRDCFGLAGNAIRRDCPPGALAG